MHEIKFFFKLKHRKLILSTYMIIKGGLLSEGILTLVPLPTKSAKSLPWAEHLNVLPLSVNIMFKSSAQKWFDSFCWQWDYVKIPSEIKPPLDGTTKWSNIIFFQASWSKIGLYLLSTLNPFSIKVHLRSISSPLSIVHFNFAP